VKKEEIGFQLWRPKEHLFTHLRFEQFLLNFLRGRWSDLGIASIVKSLNKLGPKLNTLRNRYWELGSLRLEIFPFALDALDEFHETRIPSDVIEVGVACSKKRIIDEASAGGDFQPP